MTKTKAIKKIAILCSGGDSPGMNSAIRSVVRTAIGKGIEVCGIQKGYAGLLENNFRNLDVSSVGNIIQHGGTILQTSRCPEFHKEETRSKAATILKKQKVDALVVIGGNGSFNGAMALHNEHDIAVVGIPGTIDNDIDGTDYSIGFDTAVQTAVEAVDKIRDTAHSHARTFLVEVMGRRSPAIALHVGVCTGAENIIFPNEEIKYDEIAADIKRGIKRGKYASIIIVAEGDEPGICNTIKDNLKNDHDISSRICILGHIQRGGNPTAIDRFISSRMGYVAIEEILKGSKATVTAFRSGQVVPVPFSECLNKKTEYLPQYIDLVKALSI
jgi:6-phosphofructokinase 1